MSDIRLSRDAQIKRELTELSIPTKCRYCESDIREARADCPNCGAPLTDKKNFDIKLSTGYLVAMFIFAALGGIIGFFLAIRVFLTSTPAGRKYDKGSRKLASIALVVCLLFFVLWSAAKYLGL